MSAADHAGGGARPVHREIRRAVRATQWDYILLHGAHKKIELDLRNLFDPNLVRQSLKVISAAQTVEDLAQLKFAKIGVMGQRVRKRT